MGGVKDEGCDSCKKIKKIDDKIVLIFCNGFKDEREIDKFKDWLKKFVITNRNPTAGGE